MSDETPQPAWCSAHDSIAEVFDDGSGACMYSRIVEMGSSECVLSLRRLIDPSASIVIEKDSKGNWPTWAVNVLGYKAFMLADVSETVILDALAEAAGKQEQ